MYEDEYSRRQFLRSGGAVAVPAFWGPFASDDDDGRPNDLEYENGYPLPPDHITEIRDDEAELREYQPKLYYGHLGYAEQREAKSDVTGMYGWIAESSEHDVSAYCYWNRSSTQRSIFEYWFGLDIAFKDSHSRDHEPIYVFVSPDGTVDTIVCSGGHHYGLWIDGERGPVTEDRVGGLRTHVNLAVVRPHNHFREAPDDVEGLFVSEDFDAAFGSFRDERKNWYDQGHFESTSHRAVEDPFVFYDEQRYHWWREDTNDAELNKLYIRLGLDEGASRDTLKYEEA